MYSLKLSYLYHIMFGNGIGTILFVFIINIKAPWICEIDKLDNDLFGKNVYIERVPMIYFVIKSIL